jgi:hypothetical protein
VAGTPDCIEILLARAAEVVRAEARTIAGLEQRLDARFGKAVDMRVALLRVPARARGARRAVDEALQVLARMIHEK